MPFVLDDIINNRDLIKFEECLKQYSVKEINNIEDGCVSPIVYTLRRDLKGHAKLLLKYKADINLSNSCDGSALYYITTMSVKWTKFLLKNGADPNIKCYFDTEGSYPIDECLKCALYHNRNKKLILLLDYGSRCPLECTDAEVLHIINSHPKIIFCKLMDVLFKHKYHAFFNINNRDVISEIKKHIKSEN